MPFILQDPYYDPDDGSNSMEYLEPNDSQSQKIIEISVKIFVIFLFVLALTYAIARWYACCSKREADPSDVQAIPIRRISRLSRNRAVPTRPGVNDLPPTYDEISKTGKPPGAISPPSYESLGTDRDLPTFENARVRMHDLHGKV